MRISAYLSGLLLTLGCTATAHAGVYHLQDPAWVKITQSAPDQDAVGNTPQGSHPHSNEPEVDETFRWDWVTGDPAHDPQPDLTATLTFDLTLGSCSKGPADAFSFAECFVNGGFAYANNPEAGFMEDTFAFGAETNAPGFMKTPTCTTTFAGEGFILAKVFVHAETEAYASQEQNGHNESAHAGSSTVKLKTISPE